jgi:phage-related minor tail protein
MVGERGPEMFVPNQSGSIVPNGQMASGGVNIVQNINITTGVQQTVRAEVMQMLPQISNAAKGAVLDARRRGGSFAAAF